ncbi:MAG: Ornithine cyclodeaminase [Herminiimonas sp.]|nr:Ornithine cyclodeaminase [Herminiimonas sp.]
MTLLLNNAVIQQVLTAEMTINALEISYKQLIEKEAVCRPRIDIRIPTKTPGRFYQWGTMEGGSTSGYFAIRMKSDVMEEQVYNGARTEEKFCTRPGLFCGLIFLTAVETGEPLALINDGYLQHLRVAADGAIGAKIMARENAQVLGMLGSGGMARSHVESLLRVRNIRRIQVYSPTKLNREKFAAEMEQLHGIETIVLDNPRDVYRGADILAGCTDSAVPVIEGKWLEEGMHVIAVGGRPDDVAKARFDLTLRLGTAPAPVGRPEFGTADEYLGYMARPDDELWQHRRLGKRAPVITGTGKDVMFADIVSGKTPGRLSENQITYSERGNIQGAQFFAVAGVAYEAAKAQGLGHEMPTEWFLQDIRD